MAKAAGLQHVRTEADGTAEQTSAIPDYSPKTDTVIGSGKKTLAPPARDSRIFRLTTDKRKGNVFITGTEDVYDPDKKIVRRMRLLRGYNTPWLDEQKDVPKEHIAKNQLHLQFVNGVCVIPMRDTLLLKLADLSARNINNPHKDKMPVKDIYFYEWDSVKQANEGVAEENLVIEAMQMAATAPVEDMISHAQYMHVDFVDEMGVPLDETALRNAYMKKAKNQPKLFKDSIHSPIVKMAHKIRRAISEGKIDLGKQPNTAYWVDGGFISTLPMGRDAVDFLIEFAMIPGEQNQAFANQLNDIME